jgi:hypothetical protein
MVMAETENFSLEDEATLMIQRDLATVMVVLVAKTIAISFQFYPISWVPFLEAKAKTRETTLLSSSKDGDKKCVAVLKRNSTLSSSKFEIANSLNTT